MEKYALDPKVWESVNDDWQKFRIKLLEAVNQMSSEFPAPVRLAAQKDFKEVESAMFELLCSLGHGEGGHKERN